MDELTTYEKLDLLTELYLSLAKDFDERAELIKDMDLPLYRRLIEEGSVYFSYEAKNIITSNKHSTLKLSLTFADKIIKENNNTISDVKGEGISQLSE